MTQCPVQKQTHKTSQKHAERQDATDIQNKIICLQCSFFEHLFNLYLNADDDTPIEMYE